MSKFSLKKLGLLSMAAIMSASTAYAADFE